ncbi:MAG: YaaA family protein [Microthrixaceae bacterium]
MSRRRIILIPPSEGKALGGEGPPWQQSPGALGHPLYERRREVAHALVEMLEGGTGSATPGSLERFFGVGGEALVRARDAGADVNDAATLPAIERYDGVLYQHLDAVTMTAGQQARLTRSVRILSGLWGVVAPDELIPDYRLKMSVSLGALGKLSTWWRPAVTDLIAALARGAELWNLLPQEHAAALGPTGHRVVNTAVFLEPNRAGELRPVSHWNKALKGALVSHLVRNPAATPGDLLDWEHPGGYRLQHESLEPIDGVRALRFVALGR